MGKRRWIMWQGLITPSLERCSLGPVDGGLELNGLILQAHEGTPYVARYRIQVDQAWRTRAVELELENDGRRALSLLRNPSGEWMRDGQPLNGFEDCVDIDIEWSPSTNTLPIRRLGMAVGQSVTLTATWIRLPPLEIQRLDQSYERVAEDRYRYRSGRFVADLELDADGLVVHYGVNWKAVATNGERLISASTSGDPAIGRDR